MKMEHDSDLAKRRQALQEQKKVLLELQSSDTPFNFAPSVLKARAFAPSPKLGTRALPEKFEQSAPYHGVDIPPESSLQTTIASTHFLGPLVTHSELLGDDEYLPDTHAAWAETDEKVLGLSSAPSTTAESSAGNDSPLRYQMTLRDDKVTESRCVTGINFHTKLDDVVLTSHSQRADGKLGASQGTVAVWGLDAGRGALQRSLMATSPITAMELLSITPSLVIGGTGGGNIVMWDIRSKTALPVTTFGGEDCDVTTSHGRQPVTAINTTVVPSPVFCSASVSGYLYKWSLSKPDYPISMSIIEENTGASELMFSCLDFPRSTQLFDDNLAASNRRTQVFAGTYDGSIYRLNNNGSQWSIEDGRAKHSASVTALSPHPFGHRVPFLEDIVVSSSYDWTMRLWLFRRGQPFQELALFDMIENGGVNDVQWSQKHPTIFCAGDEAGALSLFDVSSQLMPDGSSSCQLTVPRTTDRAALTRVQWDNNCQNICTGDVNGNIALWSCSSAFAGLPDAEWTAQYFKTQSARDP